MLQGLTQVKALMLQGCSHLVMDEDDDDGPAWVRFDGWDTALAPLTQARLGCMAVCRHIWADAAISAAGLQLLHSGRNVHPLPPPWLSLSRLHYGDGGT